MHRFVQTPQHYELGSRMTRGNLAALESLFAAHIVFFSSLLHGVRTLMPPVPEKREQRVGSARYNPQLRAQGAGSSPLMQVFFVIFTIIVLVSPSSSARAREDICPSLALPLCCLVYLQNQEKIPALGSRHVCLAGCPDPRLALLQRSNCYRCGLGPEGNWSSLC